MKYLRTIAVVSAISASPLLVRADQAPAPAPAPAKEEAPAAAAPAEKSWSAEVGFDYFSEYIFRGVDVLDNHPVLVPHVIGKWKGFSAYYYGYYGNSTGSDRWYEEADFGVDYTRSFLKDDFLTLTGGAIWYIYPDGTSGTDTAELYGIAAINFPLLNPKVSINWDVDEFHGGYGTAGISHVFDLTKTLNLKEPMALTVTPSAQLGIDFGNISKKTQSNVDWNDILLGLAANLQITSQFSIHAGVQFSIALNSVNDVYDAAGSAKGNEVVGNVGAVFTF